MPPPPEPTSAAHTGPIVDAHVHLWDPVHLDYAWLAGTRLNRRYDVTDLQAAAPSVRGFVVVQADCAPDQAMDELRWLQQRRIACPALLGIVAFAPLEHGRRVRPFLHALYAEPGVVGVRRLLQDEAPGFALSRDFLTGLETLAEFGLPFDLCVRAHQLTEVVDVVDLVPDVTFVLDHVGKPRVDAVDAAWRDNLSALAQRPNVVCKLSGLTTESNDPRWRAAQIQPYLRDALQRFGPSRCLFGSDWPVLTPRATHRQWLDLVSEVVVELGNDVGEFGNDVGRDAAEQVFHRTAYRVYALADQPSTEGTR